MFLNTFLNVCISKLYFTFKVNTIKLHAKDHSIKSIANSIYSHDFTTYGIASLTKDSSAYSMGKNGYKTRYKWYITVEIIKFLSKAKEKPKEKKNPEEAVQNVKETTGRCVMCYM